MMYDWNKIEQRRRVWSPSTPAPKSETCAAVATLSKCFALTDLEPQVALFVNEGLSNSDQKKIEPARATLTRNIEDEVKHEIALNNARLATSNYDSSFETEANQIIQAWKDLTDCPIAVTAVLETAIFQPALVLYARFGGISLRITANDISQDERLHSISHRQVAMDLGSRPSKRLNQLRIDTMAWLSAELNEGGFDQARMLRNSESLMRRGVSDFLESSAGSVLLPMEIANSSLSAYN